MGNERKTEGMVRTHFQKFLDFINIEEQISDYPKIQKLLQGASKKGNGSGKPEFIITFKNNKNLLVVIECKADVSKHESKPRDRFRKFTVEGALQYSSYL